MKKMTLDPSPKVMSKWQPHASGLFRVTSALMLLSNFIVNAEYIVEIYDLLHVYEKETSK